MTGRTFREGLATNRGVYSTRSLVAEACRVSQDFTAHDVWLARPNLTESTTSQLHNISTDFLTPTTTSFFPHSYKIQC